MPLFVLTYFVRLLHVEMNNISQDETCFRQFDRHCSCTHCCYGQYLRAAARSMRGTHNFV